MLTVFTWGLLLKIIFSNFCKFQPWYSYKIHSYRKKESRSKVPKLWTRCSTHTHNSSNSPTFTPPPPPHLSPDSLFYLPIPTRELCPLDMILDSSFAASFFSATFNTRRGRIANPLCQAILLNKSSLLFALRFALEQQHTLETTKKRTHEAKFAKCHSLPDISRI